MSRTTWAFALSALLLAAGQARAVVVVTSTPGSDGAPYTVTQIYTTDAAYTQSAFANSGSQFEGSFTNSLNGTAATAVAPNWVLTATHLGSGNLNNFIYVNGNPNNAHVNFSYNGQNYQVINAVDVGNGMTLVEVNKSLGTYAPIFANNNQGGATSIQGATTSDFGTGVAAGNRTDAPAFQ